VKRVSQLVYLLEHIRNNSNQPVAVYLYLNSLICTYKWTCKEKGQAPIRDKGEVQVAFSDKYISPSDLSRAYWSGREYHQWLLIYQGHWRPYLSSIKTWLATETGKVRTREPFFSGATTHIADKLIYRNSFF